MPSRVIVSLLASATVLAAVLPAQAQTQAQLTRLDGPVVIVKDRQGRVAVTFRLSRTPPKRSSTTYAGSVRVKGDVVGRPIRRARGQCFHSLLPGTPSWAAAGRQVAFRVRLPNGQTLRSSRAKVYDLAVATSVTDARAVGRDPIVRELQLCDR